MIELKNNALYPTAKSGLKPRKEMATINNANSYISEEYFANAGLFIGTNSNKKIFPPRMGGGYRFDVFFENNCVRIIKNSNGFFETGKNYIKLDMFEPYYNIGYVIFTAGVREVTLYMKRKSKYSSVESIQKIFDTLTKASAPKVEQSDYSVLRPFSENNVYTMIVVDNAKSHYLYIKAAEPEDAELYVNASVLAYKKAFFSTNHILKVFATNVQVYDFAKTFFPDGFYIYSDKNSDGFIFSHVEKCSHCCHSVHSTEGKVIESAICPECHKHINEINLITERLKQR